MESIAQAQRRMIKADARYLSEQSAQNNEDDFNRPNGLNRTDSSISLFPSGASTTIDRILLSRSGPPGFVKAAEFARELGMKVKTVRSWMRREVIFSIEHPAHGKYKVIPRSELERLKGQFRQYVPYKGPEYPHLRFLQFATIIFGGDEEGLRVDMARWKLPVPNSTILTKIRDGVFATAPDAIRNRMRRGKNYDHLSEFEPWIKCLGFRQLYEDLTDYISRPLLHNQHARLCVESLLAAGFPSFEIEKVLWAKFDGQLSMECIRRYEHYFFTMEYMDRDAWSTYLRLLAETDRSRAGHLDSCYRSRPAALIELGLTEHFDPRHELTRAMISAKARYDELIQDATRKSPTKCVQLIRTMKKIHVMLMDLDRPEG